MLQVTQLLCNRAKMGSQACLMPKPMPLPRCHAASRSPVVLQRDPAAPRPPGALSPRVLFDLLLRFFGAPKMGQVAPDPRTLPVANLEFFWWLLGPNGIQLCPLAMVIVAMFLLGAACSFLVPLLEQPAAASGVWAGRVGTAFLGGFVPQMGPPVKGRTGPWPFVLLCALCH